MLVDLIPFQGHNDGDEKKNENFKSMAQWQVKTWHLQPLRFHGTACTAKVALCTIS